MRAAAPLQQDVNNGLTARMGVQSARFFIVDLEGRASVAQLCCLGPGVSNKKNCCCKPIIFVGG